jgi:hypothetical protein
VIDTATRSYAAGPENDPLFRRRAAKATFICGLRLVGGCLL